MYFPTYRMRRMRRTPTLRRMMRETALSPDDFIYPLFVSHGENVKRPIASMPGCEQLSIGNLLPEVREIQRLGIPAVLLFGIPSHKDAAASSAYDSEGVVQLDASCMHGPTKRAGAVGCLEGIKTPSEVAKLVLKYTNNIMLVGAGAQRFALSYGFQLENLLTEASRQAWLRWRANLNSDDDYLDVPPGEQIWTAASRPTGTINCDAVNGRGEISSVTTTSGLSWKIPGRVGDSAIIGAGQYTDNDVGAAGSTGRGESNIKVCGGFLTVEGMRRGLAPTDACLEALRRVVATTEPRLLGPDGRPKFDLNFYAVNKRGQFGSAALFSGARFAVHDGTEARLVDGGFLFERPPRR